MAAQPKNKITRVERGKRRAGNTPTLTKDSKYSIVPLYKRSFFARLLNKAGMAGQTSTPRQTRSNKKVAASHQGVAAPIAQQVTPKNATTTVRKARTSQHKGV